MMKKLLCFLALIQMTQAYANKGGQLVLDQDVEWSIEKDLEKYKEDSPYVQEQIKSKDAEKVWNEKRFKDNSGSVIMGSGLDRDNNSGSGVTDFNYQVLGTAEKETSLSVTSNKEILKNVRTKGTSIFTFTYFKDDFDYNDRNNIYKRTFEEGEGAIQAGYIMFGLERYLVKRTVDITWGGNLGLGFSSAKALFVDGTQSDTRFQLYTIPFDLHLGVGLSLGRYIRLSANGGPSVMGLYQNRSDFENKEPGKNRRQLSPGYFASGKVQIALSEIFRNQAFKMFTDYQVSRLFLNIEGRTQNYSSFQDEDLEIAGTSVGVGLSFEYF
jgi:hypothetical protein